jgi:class 3 adenylate cyclase
LIGSFDKLAYRHGAFKVETVGDCYVAVAGLPDPVDDHAIYIAKFARPTELFTGIVDTPMESPLPNIDAR